MMNGISIEKSGSKNLAGFRNLPVKCLGGHPSGFKYLQDLLWGNPTGFQKWLGLVLLLLFTSCMKDDELWNFTKPSPPGPANGVFIVNEGNFTYENASLTYYDLSTGEYFNDIFFNTNGLPLGDVACSMQVRDSLGYIVINNSGRIYVVNLNTFQYTGKITGLVSPRHIHFINESKAYVSDLYARSITVVDPGSYEISGKIDLDNRSGGFYQHPTEQMLRYGKFIYVNCWSFDDKILVIDSETDELVDSIRVIKQPQSMAIDRFKKLWVLSDGGFQGSPYVTEIPGLTRINAATREVEQVIRFDEGDVVRDLKINGTGDTLFYINTHIFLLDITESSPEIFISSPYPEGSQGGFYSLGIDPYNSDVYIGDAIDFVQPGIVYRYNAAGVAVDTIRSGIAPGDFCFRPSSTF